MSPHTETSDPGAAAKAFLAAAEALSELPRDPCAPTLHASSSDAYIEQVEASWRQERPTDHRLLRIPAHLWAALLASGHSERPGGPYARLLPPDVILGIDIPALDEAGHGLVQIAAEAWLTLCNLLAESSDRSDATDVAEDLQLLREVWSNPIEALDPADDDPTTGPTEPETAALVAAQYLRVDQAARRALAALVAASDQDDRDRIADALVPILAGVWGGSVRGPRLESEWQTAADIGDIWSHQGIAAPGDVASARALLLARSGPASSQPAAWKSFIAWGYGRASTWPRFRSPDPQLHDWILEGRYGSGDTNHEPTDLWPDEVKAAVTTGRVLERAPEIVVRQQGVGVAELLAELDAMVGLQDAKQEIRNWIAMEKLEQERRGAGAPAQPITRHLVLTGNPGTGKTTLARLLARLYKASGILSRGSVLELQRSDLVGAYLGQTEDKTVAAVNRADGGVLFIDEAYALARDGRDYGQEAIEVLVSEMEKRRDSLVVIVAGYTEPMHQFLSANPGLASRLPRQLKLPDLPNTALVDVFEGFAEQGGYRLAEEVPAAVLGHFEGIQRGHGFGNGRAVRNLFDVARQRLAARYFADNGGVDINLITADCIPSAHVHLEIDEQRLSAALRPLETMVGLASVKSSIQGFVDQARIAEAKHDRGISGTPLAAPHMVFRGPPGTGKTSVAGLLGEVLAALGLLKSGHVVTVTRNELIGRYIGQTAPKVTARVREAQDGVLFIDEAYSLASADDSRDFGHEAVSTLLEQMERLRGSFVVVLAGYEQPMKRLLDMNVGLRSRIGLDLAFAPFSEEELEDVARRDAAARKLQLTEGAAHAAARSTYAMRNEPGYANARTLRSILDDAERNLMRRLGRRTDKGAIGTEEFVTIEVHDVPIVEEETPEQYGQYL